MKRTTRGKSRNKRNRGKAIRANRPDFRKVKDKWESTKPRQTIGKKKK